MRSTRGAAGASGGGGYSSQYRSSKGSASVEPRSYRRRSSPALGDEASSCSRPAPTGMVSQGPGAVSTSVRGGGDFMTARIPVQAHVSIGAPNMRRGLGGPSGPSRSSSGRLDEGGQPSSSSSASGGMAFTVGDDAPARRQRPLPPASQRRRSGDEGAENGGRGSGDFGRRPTGAGAGDGACFLRPPADPAGRLCDASDRPLLCMSVRGEEVVVGGADHALYAYDLESGKLTRRLYTKTHGHIDWVSCVAHLPDGRVLSGGGDGKVCLWPARRGTQCFDLDGHASAVSKVQGVADSHKLAWSAAYDGKIKLWDTCSRRMLTCLDGLEAVMDFAWAGNVLMGGNRKGYCQVWDLQRADMIRSLKAHKGHVTVVSTWPPASSSSTSSDSTLFLSGGQDGLLRVWDSRCETCVHKVECHTSARSGTGAVSCVEVTDSLVITAGADKRICVLEPRNGFGMLHQLEEHADFIYSLHAPAAGGVVFSGAGNGMVLCHSLVEGRALYGMGANQGAVRCLATQGEHLVAAGDDGKCLMYDY